MCQAPSNFLVARHFGIDIETGSLYGTPFVFSISLARLGDDWKPQFVKTWVLSSRGQEKSHLDGETVLWWLKQDKLAQDSFASEAARASAVHIYTALMEIYDILKGDGSDFALWAKPQHFDITILENLYRQHSPNKGSELLHRRKCHNARTLYQAVSMLTGELVEEEPGEGFVKHDPTADVMLTMATVGRCLQRLVACNVLLTSGAA